MSERSERVSDTVSEALCAELAQWSVPGEGTVRGWAPSGGPDQ